MNEKLARRAENLRKLANDEHPYGTGPFDSHQIVILRDDAAELADLLDEIDRLRKVEQAAQAYVTAGLNGNPDISAEFHELVRVARTDGAR